MSIHPTAAEKLLAMLDDDHAIETLDAKEVQADLALFGLDPAPAIAVARALAAGRDTPGGRLLGGIGAAEDLEGEIARIESASIEEVRAGIPGGTAATIAARARRRAGGDSTVVGMERRRRSRLLVWGAPAAGIAASLLVVVVGYEVLTVRSTGGPMQFADRGVPSPVAESEAPPLGGESTLREAPMERSAPDLRALEADEAGDAATAKRARRDAGASSASESGEDVREMFAGDPATLETDSAGKGYLPAAPDPRDQRSEQEQQTRPVDNFGRNQAEPENRAVGMLAEPAPPLQDRLAGSGAGVAGAMPRVVAVLLVDVVQAPEAMKSQALPADGLADRLNEARALAAGRDLVALIALEAPGGRAEFAQVRVAPGMTQQLSPPAPIADLLGADATAYDFIALPAP